MLNWKKNVEKEFPIIYFLGKSKNVCHDLDKINNGVWKSDVTRRRFRDTLEITALEH